MPVALAASFGEMTLYSRIGEPLYAEVPLLQFEGEPASNCFSVVAAASGNELPGITGANLRITRPASGARLIISTPQAISEPIFALGLRAACGLELQRDFVLMPEPPISITDNLALATPISETPARAAAPRPLARPPLPAKPDTRPHTQAVAPKPMARVPRAAPLPKPPAELPKAAPTPPGAAPAAAEPPPPPPAPATLPTKAQGDRLMLSGAPEGNLGKVSPQQASLDAMAERVMHMENTMRTLNQEIDKLSSALAVTTEALVAQSRLQQLQQLQQAQAGNAPATPPLTLPVAPPPTPPAPARNSFADGGWIELVLSALAGSALAAGLAAWFSRRQARGQHASRFDFTAFRQSKPRNTP